MLLLDLAGLNISNHLKTNRKCLHYKRNVSDIFYYVWISSKELTSCSCEYGYRTCAVMLVISCWIKRPCLNYFYAYLCSSFVDHLSLDLSTSMYSPYFILSTKKL